MRPWSHPGAYCSRQHPPYSAWSMSRKFMHVVTEWIKVSMILASNRLWLHMTARFMSWDNTNLFGSTLKAALFGSKEPKVPIITSLHRYHWIQHTLLNFLIIISQGRSVPIRVVWHLHLTFHLIFSCDEWEVIYHFFHHLHLHVYFVILHTLIFYLYISVYHNSEHIDEIQIRRRNNAVKSRNTERSHHPDAKNIPAQPHCNIRFYHG